MSSRVPPSISASFRPTVLLVEDDENDVFFARRALRTAGAEAEVRVVNDGQSAMDYLAGKREFEDRMLHPFPTLLLLDLKLPYQSGLNVLAWWRAQNSPEDLRVVVLTGSYEPADVKRAKELSADFYHVKPINGTMLQQVSVRLGLSWLAKLPGDNRAQSPAPRSPST